MGCQRVELSVFWKPSNAMNTGSLFFFFGMANQALIS